MNIHTFTVHSGQSNNMTFPSIQDPSKTLVIMFGASDLDAGPEIIQRVWSEYPGVAVIGCSTYGEIVGQEIYDETVSVTIVEFERTALRLASANIHDSIESYSAGETLSQELLTPELRGIFVLSDGLMVNGSELARGFECSSSGTGHRDGRASR